MSKYDGLGSYLQTQSLAEVPMTFAEIEKVTGTKLPPKAQHHRAWWSNNPSNNVMTKIWLGAGYETARVDMESRKLVFKRIAKSGGGMSDGAREFAQEAVEKSQGRHPLIGSMKGTFTLVPSSEAEPSADDPESWEALALAKLDRLLFGKGE